MSLIHKLAEITPLNLGHLGTILLNILQVGCPLHELLPGHRYGILASAMFFQIHLTSGSIKLIKIVKLINLSHAAFADFCSCPGPRELLETYGHLWKAVLRVSPWCIWELAG